MSTYYYLYCIECNKKSNGFHARQAWGSWTQEIDNEFMEEHRDHKPYVISEHAAENDL